MFSFPDSLKNLLTAVPGVPHGPFTLTKLAGEASLREYYRIRFADGQTRVVMKMPEGYSSVSEEVTKSSGKITELPFLNVQKYLAKFQVRVPRVDFYSEKDGLMILEDLGDDTFEKVFVSGSRSAGLELYRRALGLLASFQKGTRQKDPGCVVFHRQFDEDLLYWEFNHFLEYGIEDRLNLKIPPAERKEFEEIGHAICREIVALPQGLTHRDFQSRNIMVAGGEMVLIDFQDALGGPVVYDLVALLRDSYIVLTAAEVTGLVADYAGLVDPAHPYKNQPEKLLADFDLMTIQRKLKDAGRFQYILTVRKNPDFLPHVPASLQYVREAIGRLPRFARLSDMIAGYLPEFRGGQ